MAIKKSELYSSLWASCDELRGGMDASQYKDYVLVLLFIKYISDKYAGQPFAPITIPAGAGFADMVALKGKSDIGDQINKKIIAPLAEANKLADLPDFNDANKLGTGKEMVERLTNLIAIFENPALDFSKNRAEHDDILGDAYEFLMQHFAKDSGKSKGQFYTPSEVSRVVASIIGIGAAPTSAETSVYDPTCGSGSLLLKVADEAGTPVSLYGQEKDSATSSLARMNMILHNNPTALIAQGNTLTDPRFTVSAGGHDLLKTFDYVVANPPFSDKRWSTGLDPQNDPHGRFETFGAPPAKQGDYAYLLHIIRSLKSTGTAACILPHGVLFRGNAEAEIRRNLIRHGYIKGIIGLPANLFYGTGIPACIIVIDKANAAARKGIFMLDASAGFIKDGPKNRLREQDVHRIVDAFTRQDDSEPSYARMVGYEEIEKNDFNLNLPRYIDSSQAEDRQDIEGHLRGGIPAADIEALESYWAVCPQLKTALFNANRPGYFDLAVDKAAIKTAIYGHPEFANFIAGMAEHFATWREQTAEKLKALQPGFHPKELIHEVAESLLQHFRGKPLIDAYDVYQHLLDYWADVMQDDAYLIAADGWKAETYPVIEIVKSGKKKGEVKEKGWACDLIPKPFVVARYLAAEQAAIDALKCDLDDITTQFDELTEEHAGDDGILKDVSTKSDAEDTYAVVLGALWNEHDRSSYAAYNLLIQHAEASSAQRNKCADHYHLSALKNAKGRLTYKAVKDRLATLHIGGEYSALNEYLEYDQEQKRASREAAERFAIIEDKFLSRLNEQPLPEGFQDLDVMVRFIDMLDQQSILKSQIKAKEEELDILAFNKYRLLSEDEIKSLAVEDKWLATIEAAVSGEMDRVSQTLTRRVKVLAERYETPLPQLAQRVSELEAKVAAHLEKMGFVWS